MLVLPQGAGLEAKVFRVDGEFPCSALIHPTSKGDEQKECVVRTICQPSAKHSAVSILTAHATARRRNPLFLKKDLGTQRGCS